MKSTKRNLFGVSVALLMSVTLAQAADGPESGKLEGTWLTQVAIRDCGTSAVLRTFSAINTFNSAETMIDTTAGASPALRSPGLGTWEKSGGRTYRAVSLAFLFNPSGLWIGTQRLTHIIEVTGDDNAFTTRSEVFDPAGTLLSSGCATATGRRL